MFQDVLDLRLRVLRQGTQLADWQAVLAAAEAPARSLALDWGGPDSLRERVRLEAVRALFHESDELPDVKWRDEAAEVGGLDGERLRSALLERQLSRRALAFEELFALEQTMGSMHDARPRCRAHLRFPPLFVTLVIGWVGLGDATRAGAIISQAPEPWSARLLHMMTRRLRLTRSAERLQRLLADRRKPDFNAVCALALNVPVDDKDLAFLPVGQRLAVAEARDAEQCLALVARGAGERPDSDDPLVATRHALLGLELVELSRYTPAPQAAGEDVELPAGESPDRWAEAMRVALVRDALLGRLGGPEWRAQAHASRRAAGFLALEEGELLARRLPGRAVPLLVLAADWLEDAGDLLTCWQALLRAGIAERHAGRQRSDVRERLAQLTARVEIDKLLPASSGWHARCAAYFGAATKEPSSRTLELAMRPFLRGDPRTPSVGLRMSSWTRRHATILVTVAVASIALAGAIYAFFWLYWPWAEGLLAGLGAPSFVAYFGPILLLAILTQLSKLAGWAGSTLDLVGGLVRLYRRGTQSVQIDGTLGAQLTLSLRHRTAFGFYSIDSAVPALDDDAEQAAGFAGLSADLKASLAALQRRRFGPRLAAPLSLPRAASGACVEGWLAAAAATPADALLFYRQVGGQGEPATQRDLHAVAPPALVVEVRKAWGERPPPLMHLVARAVRTARGAAIVQVVASASQATRTVKLGDEVTLLAEDVPGFEGRLLILQAEPDESVERTGADRRAAAVQRELAASFMDAGAAAVLVLPALPRALGLRIVHALAGVFGSAAPDRGKMLAGLRRAREIVAGEARLGPEPIWDVTLLLRE